MNLRYYRLKADSDVSEAIAFISEVFGPRDGVDSKFSKWVSDPSFSVIAADVDGVVAGVSVARVEANFSRCGYAHFGEQALAGLDGRRLGSFQLLAIAPAFRRSGVGELLARAQLAWVRDEQRCEGAIGVSWDHGGEGTSAHLFRKGGFTSRGQARDFYLDGSRRSGHRCPVCEGECRCPATLFVLLWAHDST